VSVSENFYIQSVNNIRPKSGC